MQETLEFYRRLDDIHDRGRAELRQWLDDAIGFFERHHEVHQFAEEAFSAEANVEELSPPRVLDRCAAAMPRYLGRYEGRQRQQAQLQLELLIWQISRFCRLWVSGRWPVNRDLALDVLLALWANGLGCGQSLAQRHGGAAR